METVTCPNCGKAYQFSEEQFSKSKEIVFPCLGCKHPITVEQPSDSGDEAVQAVKERPDGGGRLKKSGKSKDRELEDGEKLRKKIFRALDNLPPMSQVVHRALEIMADPDYGMKDLANAIETDQSMVSNILRIANSAYFGAIARISSIQNACVMLGNHALRELIIMAGVSKLLERTLRGYGFVSGELWKHSISSALGSKMVAEKKAPHISDDAYVAGLIHDIGKIVLDDYILERKDKFELILNNGTRTYLEAEKDILGFDHTEIASEICIRWNFPEDIAFAVRYHHYPSLSKGNDLAYMVHLADFLAKSCGFGCGKDDVAYQLEEGTGEFLSLEQEDIDGIKSELFESMERLNFEVP